jgi:hypothetical protein
MGADSYDAYFAKDASSEALIAEFQKINAPFVWQAESNLFPDFDTLPPWTKKHYPYPNDNGKSPYKFLNFGGWVGNASSAFKIFDEIQSIMRNCSIYCEAASGIGRWAHHDQHAAQLLFASQSYLGKAIPKQVVDYQNAMFHAAWPKCDSLSKRTDGNFVVRETGKSPLMIHLNGDAKFNCPNMYNDTWFLDDQHKPQLRANTSRLRTVLMLSLYPDNKRAELVDAESICPNIWNNTFMRSSMNTWRDQIIKKRYKPM